MEPSDSDTRALLDRLAASYAAAPAAELDIDAAAVGPELATLLTERDPAAAGDSHDVVELVAGWARQVAHAEAGLARALAALAARVELRPAETGYRSVNPVTNTAVVVAGRCQLTTKQAEGMVGPAVQLLRDFPDTWAAWWAGLIDWRRVRAILDELGGQDPDVRSRVEAAVLPQAPHLDSVALRKLIKRLLHELAPVTVAERHRRAREARYVAITPASDGMAHLEALLPAEDAIALNARLNADAADLKRADLAARRPVRTKDQRRADALCAFAWASATTAGGPPRRQVSVHVTIPFGTLAGLSEEPGELEGYGPIPAHIARKLAAEGVWRWLATDPGSGRVMDLGRTTYRPTKALADFIIARDRTCRMPGCHRPARYCHIDHRDPYQNGGATSAANCQCLCETHHLLKHHGHWRCATLPNGTTVWTSPTGHRFLKPPARAG
ncbi:DUF222 domain-containing protein [Jiangella mangrovi]|uniref:HNH nuclease domain-containing protein n=1 Tax=Jiangella mangrovi TaxID=1524084 RepID=A0A7W9LMQ8_9ACTN|nr:hypothetical protein [Jiangella mangrovi]